MYILDTGPIFKFLTTVASPSCWLHWATTSCTSALGVRCAAACGVVRRGRRVDEGGLGLWIAALGVVILAGRVRPVLVN